MSRFSALLVLIAITFSAGPVTAADANSSDSSRLLHLRAATVDTRTTPDLRSETPQRADIAAKSHYVVQLDGPMTPQRREALAQAGVRLGDYLPDHAYIAELDPAAPAALAALDFVTWTGTYEDSWKIDPDIGSRLEPFQTQERIAIDAQNLYKLSVTLFAGSDLEEAKAELSDLGAEVHVGEMVGDQGVVGLVMAKDRLPLLATSPSVQFIEEASEVTLRNSTNRWIVQSNINNVTPLYDNGITGIGQIIGIIDGRVSVNHCSFTDTNPIGPTHRKIEAYNTSLGSDTHGTHVAGTCVGDAGVNNDTRGIAYDGRLVYNTIPSFTETAIVSDLNLHHSQGARIHTNSWGDDGTTAYNGLARGFDVFQYDNEESLCLLAVTNTSSLRNPENAKNLLAVGASQDTPNQDSHCSGGVGPTSDGRRKPEIYAPGCGTNSSNGSACGTVALTGTSMACPAVAGTAMLVRQYYMDGFYPSGMPMPAEAFTPSAALVKATLLNSAVDMTNISGYPSNLEGWGRVLADNALYFDGDTRSLVVFDVWNANGLSTGQSQTYDFTVVGTSEALRVTMVFTDAPGASGASNPVVNNLDLELSAPDGTLYKGNWFSGGQSAPNGTADAKNNVEQILIPSPMQGIWSVEIKGTAVNQGTQGYAVVISGEARLGPAPPKTEDFDVTVAVDGSMTITLIGEDIDEDPLDFIIMQLPQHGDLSEPDGTPITSAPHVISGKGDRVNYAPYGAYVGTDAFVYKANDGGTPPDGGDSNESTASILVLAAPPLIMTDSLPDAALDEPYSDVQFEALAGQPPLVWEEIRDVAYEETDLGTNGYTEIGAGMDWSGDDRFWYYDLPFPFKFYGETHTTIRIWTNGFIDFGEFEGSSYANNPTVLSNNRMIAPLWDDLRTSMDGQDIFMDESAPGEVTIRWVAGTYAGNHPVECALTLYNTGKIRFHYGAGNDPITPTIGISSGDGANFTLASYNGSTSLPYAASIEIAQPDLLPPGMTFDANGLLGGTPTASGTFQPVFRVTDSLGRFDQRSITLVVAAPPNGDFDGDGDVDLDDLAAFADCMAGPGAAPPQSGGFTETECLEALDFDADGDVDLVDFASFEAVFGI